MLFASQGGSGWTRVFEREDGAGDTPDASPVAGRRVGWGLEVRTVADLMVGVERMGHMRKVVGV